MDHDEQRIWDSYFLGVARPIEGGSIISWEGEYHNDSPVWYMMTGEREKQLVRCIDGNWYMASNSEYSYIIPQEPSSKYFPRSIIQQPKAQVIFDELEYLTQHFEQKERWGKCDKIVSFLMSIFPLPMELIYYILSWLRNVEVEVLEWSGLK